MSNLWFRYKLLDDEIKNLSFSLIISLVFESIIRHNDIVRKAIPHVYVTITEKFFRRSYLHLFTSNLLQLPLVKYSPVTFFGNVTLFPKHAVHKTHGDNLVNS